MLYILLSARGTFATEIKPFIDYFVAKVTLNINFVISRK